MKEKDNKSKIIDVKYNEILNKIELLAEQFVNLIPEINLFDNYNHRTIRIESIIKELWPDFVLNKSRNKEDAKCPSLNLNKIEIKTKNYKNNAPKELTMFNSKFMFDKQDRESRRNYILKFDALVFCVFIREKLHWISWTSDTKTIKEYQILCENKQKEFIKYWEEKQKRKDQNGGNDAIKLSLSEFNDSTTWNFYIDGKIYKNITLKYIKELLKIN